MHPSGVDKSSTSFGWGKGGNVTSAGWQVTLCDPIWYVSSRSSDGRSACKLLYALYFTLLLAGQKWQTIIKPSTVQRQYTEHLWIEVSDDIVSKLSNDVWSAGAGTFPARLTVWPFTDLK